MIIKVTFKKALKTLLRLIEPLVATNIIAKLAAKLSRTPLYLTSSQIKLLKNEYESKNVLINKVIGNINKIRKNLISVL